MRNLRGLALGAVLAVFSLVAFADRGPEPAPTAQNVVRTTVLLSDGGAPIWYVNMAGNDARDCMSPATACATPQGAINKIPKMLRHQATVSIDAGTYPGFIVSGFSADNGLQQTTGGLIIDGALANSTLATGSATGTATGGSSGSGVSYGTLINTGATWTANDLIGRFISTTNPTNAPLVISANSSTTVTIVGPWNAPTASTTYVIQDPSAKINTAVKIPSVSTFGEAGVTGVFVGGNTIGFANRALTISNQRIAPASALMGLNLADGSSVYLKNLQIRPGGAFPAGVYLDYSGTGVPFVEIAFCDISINSFANGLHALSGGFSLAGNTFRNAQANGTAIQVGQGQGKSSTVMQLFTYNSMTGFLNGLAMPLGTFTDDFTGFKGARITCGSSSGIALQIGTSTTGTGRPNFIQVNSTNVATCGTALQVTGPSTADVTAMSGSAGTTGFDVRLGGVITYSKAGMTLTAGTNEVNIENGEVVGTFAAGTAGQCRVSSTSGNYSRVCAR